MNDVIPFTHETFGTVRSTIIDGDPWFVGVDACKALGVKDPTTPIRILDEDEKGVHTMHTPGGDQNLAIINEAGLYSLILRSRKPAASSYSQETSTTSASMLRGKMPARKMSRRGSS